MTALIGATAVSVLSGTALEAASRRTAAIRLLTLTYATRLGFGKEEAIAAL